MNIKISNIAKLPSKYGDFKIQSFKDKDKEHLVIFKEPILDNTLLRIHSECLTGDALGSLKCDCQAQLHHALQLISKENGMVIYLRQEGRGIGLFNKVNAYELQDRGFNTIEANHQLGFETDLRDYKIVEYILNYYKIKKINLITNNPNKINSLKNFEILQRIPSITPTNKHNQNYLEIKKESLGHFL
ncbi:GTP cyclohydrolase II [Malaciobacter marinus]|uniref:GTP cyclohydrolase-2 n=1 Tax=Malaciobacter marinus TaxID=505249 RepID=A0A347TPA2_9BACT|nr:GTP cyclohydrolase II [Malaciobacter marinus]AXX88430.1 GTP cyclohydrolase II [Malaciobacter marinus]PHO14169.1 GTP cyclohydrolase II [Malaciobacter marinus]